MPLNTISTLVAFVIDPPVMTPLFVSVSKMTTFDKVAFEIVPSLIVPVMVLVSLNVLFCKITSVK